MDERNRLAAALTRGPAEVLDFFLPLWVGAQLGASAAEVGALTALETLVSFLVRPIAGALADRMDRGRLAGVGAVLYGLSFAGYVATPSIGPAFFAAVLGGAGGALFWVALRARVGESLSRDDGAFGKLFAAEGAGTWIAFVVAIPLVSKIDYRGVFALGGVACLVAAAVLFAPSGERPPAPVVSDGPRFAQLGRRMWPMLVLVVITALAEGGVALLLLMHLQRGHQLPLASIAYVFLPGFIVYSTLPDYLHRVVRNLGRTRVLSLAMVASAVFAAGLSFAPNPWVIAGIWILAAAAFAAAIPVQQAIVAEAAGGSLGRGMGIYEGATLLGATIGTFTAGLLYAIGNGWQLACLGAAALLVLSALLVPLAIRKVDVPDRPPVLLPAKDPVPAAEPAPVLLPAKEREAKVAKPPSLRNWGIHLGIFAVVQVGLTIAGYGWLAEAVFGPARDLGWYLNDAGHWALNLGRIWTAVLLIDTAWTWTLYLRRR